MTARAAETAASWPTPLDYMLFVVREVKARLEWLKGKKWGNPAGGDRILEARNR
jgi:hypothetical protein